MRLEPRIILKVLLNFSDIVNFILLWISARLDSELNFSLDI